MANKFQSYSTYIHYFQGGGEASSEKTFLLQELPAKVRRLVVVLKNPCAASTNKTQTLPLGSGSEMNSRKLIFIILLCVACGCGLVGFVATAGAVRSYENFQNIDSQNTKSLSKNIFEVVTSNVMSIRERVVSVNMMAKL